MLHVENITLNQVKKAAADGQNITVIINGEFYTLTAEETTEETTAFIEGVKFAAAAIEDHRARINFIFQANDARNKEAKNEIDFLLHIIKPEAGFDTWQKEYHGGKLWKLEG